MTDKFSVPYGPEHISVDLAKLSDEQLLKIVNDWIRGEDVASRYQLPEEDLKIFMVNDERAGKMIQEAYAALDKPLPKVSAPSWFNDVEDEEYLSTLSDRDRILRAKPLRTDAGKMNNNITTEVEANWNVSDDNSDTTPPQLTEGNRQD